MPQISIAAPCIAGHSTKTSCDPSTIRETDPMVGAGEGASGGETPGTAGGIRNRSRSMAAAFCIFPVIVALIAPDAKAQYAVQRIPPFAGWGAPEFGDLSADGRTLVGRFFYHPTQAPRDFVWREGVGRADGPDGMECWSVSADGSVLGGFHFGARQACTWSSAAGFRYLGANTGYVRDLSGDGSVAIGWIEPNQTSHYRWTAQSGAVELPRLGGSARANAVSRDGRLVVGSDSRGAGELGVRWTSAGVLEELQIDGPAFAINNDGSLIFGVHQGGLARVTAGAPPERLGNLSSWGTRTKWACSDSGSVVACGSRVWSRATGFVESKAFLLARGVSSDGWTVLYALGVSADGLALAGTGDWNGEFSFWHARLPCPADLDNDGVISNGGTRDGGVTIEDLLYYLGQFSLGVVAADLDDGSGTGTPDGGVGIEDLLYFMQRYDAGC